MTVKVVQGHCRCCHLIGQNAIYDFLLDYQYKRIPIWYHLRDINMFAKIVRRHVTVTTPT